jgi:hypothetical protein
MQSNNMTNSYCFIRIAHYLCAASTAVLCAVTANALPDYDVDCRSCHGTAKNGTCESSNHPGAGNARIKALGALLTRAFGVVGVMAAS